MARLPVMLTRGRLLALTALLPIALATCSGPGSPTMTPTRATGLTRQAAIAAAQRAHPFDGVIGASTGRIDSFEPGVGVVPGERLVWAVVVTGHFQGSCGPALYPGWAPHPCPSPATTATALVRRRGTLEPEAVTGW